MKKQEDPARPKPLCEFFSDRKSKGNRISASLFRVLRLTSLGLRLCCTQARVWGMKGEHPRSGREPAGASEFLIEPRADVE